jgi:hypothetical protein
MPSLRADLDLPERPGDKGPDGADGDDLPEPAFEQRRKRQTILEVRRRDIDLPEVPGRADGRPIDDEQRCRRSRKEDRRDTEEADVERSDPEVEQIAADQRAAADAVFPSRS